MQKLRSTDGGHYFAPSKAPPKRVYCSGDLGVEIDALEGEFQGGFKGISWECQGVLGRCFGVF